MLGGHVKSFRFSCDQVDHMAYRPARSAHRREISTAEADTESLLDRNNQVYVGHRIPAIDVGGLRNVRNDQLVVVEHRADYGLQLELDVLPWCTHGLWLLRDEMSQRAPSHI
jgi:hypothetical protein